MEIAAPSPGTARPRDVPRRTPVATDPEDRWVRRWCIVAGSALLAALLFPTAVPRFQVDRLESTGPEITIEWQYLWEILDGVEALPVLLVLATAGLGAMAILAGLALRGRSRGAIPLLWGMVVVTLYLVNAISIAREMPEPLRPRTMALLVFTTLLTLAAPTQAAGNHLRRRMPASGTAGVVTGLAGSAIVLGLLVPFVDGEPLLFAGFAASGTEGASGPGGIPLLALLVYGALGTLGFARRLAPILPLVTSVLARLIVLGLLASTVVTALAAPSTEGALRVAAIVGSVKILVLIASLFALIGVGLVAVIGPAVRARATRAEVEQRLRVARETF